MARSQHFTLKQDAYRVTRGGWSRFLNLYCAHCGTHLFLYQKDGPGTLFRCYHDRIFAPASLTGLERLPFSEVPNLVCPSCKSLIGTPYIWEEESRPSFLLDQQAFTKKIGKGIYPPPE